MIGIDVLEIDRLERALERRPRLAERVFSPAELAYAASRRRPASHLAARFAAKEAAVKALGAGGLALREVEVAWGRPRAARAAAARAGGRGGRASRGWSSRCRSPLARDRRRGGPRRPPLA